MCHPEGAAYTTVASAVSRLLQLEQRWLGLRGPSRWTGPWAGKFWAGVPITFCKRLKGSVRARGKHKCEGHQQYIGWQTHYIEMERDSTKQVSKEYCIWQALPVQLKMRRKNIIQVVTEGPPCFSVDHYPANA